LEKTQENKVDCDNFYKFSVNKRLSSFGVMVSTLLSLIQYLVERLGEKVPRQAKRATAVACVGRLPAYWSCPEITDHYECPKTIPTHREYNIN
jgi:hypothetical protein